MDGVCQLYEQRLRLQNTDKTEINYDVHQLFTYLDSLKDLGAMVYNVNIKAYEPKGRDWIKQQVYCGLKGQAHVWPSSPAPIENMYKPFQ